MAYLEITRGLHAGASPGQTTWDNTRKNDALAIRPGNKPIEGAHCGALTAAMTLRRLCLVSLARRVSACVSDLEGKQCFDAFHMNSVALL